MYVLSLYINMEHGPYKRQKKNSCGTMLLENDKNSMFIEGIEHTFIPDREGGGQR